MQELSVGTKIEKPLKQNVMSKPKSVSASSNPTPSASHLYQHWLSFRNPLLLGGIVLSTIFGSVGFFSSYLSMSSSIICGGILAAVILFLVFKRQ